MGSPVSKPFALDEIEVRDERAGNRQPQRGIHVIRRGRGEVFCRQKADLVRREDEEEQCQKDGRYLTVFRPDIAFKLRAKTFDDHFDHILPAPRDQGSASGRCKYGDEDNDGSKPRGKKRIHIYRHTKELLYNMCTRMKMHILTPFLLQGYQENYSLIKPTSRSTTVATGSVSKPPKKPKISIGEKMTATQRRISRTKRSMVQTTRRRPMYSTLFPSLSHFLKRKSMASKKKI